MPKHLSHLDPRGTIQLSLKTGNVALARHRRDAMEHADDALWAALSAPSGQSMVTMHEVYKRACDTAKSLGFPYKTLDELADGPSSELVARIEALEGRVRVEAPSAGPIVESVLGGVSEPQTTITDAMESYFELQGPIEMKGKSQRQIKSWTKVKRRAVKNFVALAGDKAMVSIDRNDALAFHDWWKDRVTGADGGRTLSGNSANRDLGNLRVLYGWFFGRRADMRADPFAGLSFPNPKSEQQDVPPFPRRWIEDRLLAHDAWRGLNWQAALIFLCLVETGCRPSEVCNLTAEQIILDADVPYIHVKPRADRGLKTEGSERRIPLIGVSLEAFKAAPKGFARYRDKENGLSATLMKHFRSRALFPTPAHVIYSIRHSFEDRTLEAQLDRDLRARLMGHAVARPDYGEGGSLAFRRQELQKIALPFPADLIAGIANG